MVVQRLWLIFAILLLSTTIAQATNYTFPGSLPAGCSGSSGTYTCSALTLGSSDSVSIAAPMPATITVNGNLSINTTPINAAGTAANLNLIVTGVLSAANLSSPLKINANITAGSINDQSGYLSIGGSLSTTTGSITLGYQTNVAGAITSSSGAISTGQSGVVGGAISSTSGNISIGYAAQVGSVTTGGTISFAQSSTASGCATSSGSSAGITLGYQATVNSVCCGSSCSNSCVTNNSTYAMPAQCAASSVSPTPLAEYRMDESGWSGVSGEINDNSANNLDGTAQGGATTAAGKICQGGSFNGSSNYAQVPDNSLLRLTGSYTIAAWVKTSTVGLNTIVSKNGSGSPWSGYEYAAGSGTGAGKQTVWLGSGSWLVSNGAAVGSGSWRHVAVTVSGNSLQFYLDGVANGTVATTSGATTYATSALYIGLNSDYSLGARYFNGQMDELKLWNTALSAAQIQAGYNNEAASNNWDGSTRTCPIVVSTTPASFNAFDTSTAANSTSGYIQTKIAGTAFSFDVVALTSTPSVLTSFSGAVKAELVDATTSATCSAMTSLQTVSASYAFQSSDLGRHTFSSVTQPQAYPNVKVRISYPATSSTTVVCSSDAFAIRPNNFVVTATDSTWSTAGTARTLNASTASGAPTHKAGQPLTLTVTPYNSSGTVVTSTYNGTPLAAASCTLPTSNCVVAAFNAGSFILSGGIATSNTANYAEVGAVNLTVTDATYAAIDTSDGTSISQRTISSTAITVGRFVPDHFDATLNTPFFNPGCTTFTYIGQPIKYWMNPIATITAKNASGAATQNYTAASGLFKISPANATYGITPSYAEASQALTVLNSAVPVAADTGNGVSTLTFADTSSNILNITRPSNPINVFAANIALSFTLQDTDAVTVGNVNGVAATNPVHFGTASSGNGISFYGGNNNQKWGRLAMSNVNGSELTALAVPVFAEYYNGSAFVGNTADNCTTISLASQISLSNPSTSSGALQAGTATMTVGSGASQATLSNTTLSSGADTLSFSAPGAGNTGYINISSNIAGLLPWLLYPWNQGGTGNTSPSAVATFGTFQGNPKAIFFKEVY